MGRSKRFAIVGAGIGGLTLAIAMQRKGFNVSIFENAPSLKPLGAGLALAANAVNGFAEIGISEAVLKAGSVLKKLLIRDDKGRILAETDSEIISKKFNTVNNFTIHRADLHDVLLQHISGNVHLGKACVDFVQSAAGIKLIFQDGSTHDTDFVIACDGIHSIFRKKLLPESQLRYAGYTCWRAVIDKVPPSVDMQVTSETWGRGSRFGIAPLSNGRLYWFACLNARENDPAMRNFRVKNLLDHFGKFHSPIREILEHTSDEQLIWNDIVDIEPIKKFAFGNIVLLGDAAHATTPNMGQGACLAIEDAVILANTIADSGSVEEAFVAFEQKRIKRTTLVVNDSLKLGRIAQLENPLLIKIRNLLLRLTPQFVAEKQIRFLIDVKFH